jgi:hypothetical protein
MTAFIPMPRLNVLFVTGMLALLSVSAARAEKSDEALLKRGTPDIESTFVVNDTDPTGFELCNTLYTATSGTTLLLKTITGSFSVPPGGFGSVQLQVTLLGGNVATLDVPMQRTAPAKQEAGIYDQYSGSLQLGGIPVISLQACVQGINSVLGLEAIGFVVKTS